MPGIKVFMVRAGFARVSNHEDLSNGVPCVVRDAALRLLTMKELGQRYA